jgi:hypothetical protein
MRRKREGECTEFFRGICRVTGLPVKEYDATLCADFRRKQKHTTKQPQSSS